VKRARTPNILIAVDTALLKEMRETEKQLAMELGEWTEKQQHEISGKGGKDLPSLAIIVNGTPATPAPRPSAADDGE
jgi:hypothetical protein